MEVIGRLDKPRKFCSMTGIKALNTALALGYKKIVFCGLDATQFLGLSADQEGTVSEAYIHSYSTSFGLNTVRALKSESMKSRLYGYYKQFRDYELISEFAKIKGIEVINVGPSSMVDSFERQEIAAVL